MDKLLWLLGIRSFQCLQHSNIVLEISMAKTGLFRSRTFPRIWQSLTESEGTETDQMDPNGLSLGSSGSIFSGQAGFGLFSVWTIRRPASTEAGGAGGILQNAVPSAKKATHGAINWNDPSPAQEKSTSMAKMSRVVLGNWPALESSPWAHNSLLACSCWG